MSDVPSHMPESDLPLTTVRDLARQVHALCQGTTLTAAAIIGVLEFVKASILHDVLSDVDEKLADDDDAQSRYFEE